VSETRPQPAVINRLLDAVYPSFAMLAGIELDLFTPLKDGPLTLEQLASATGVQAVKLRPLLYALVVAGLLTLEENLFANTREAGHYLVRGKPAYLGGLGELTASTWSGIIRDTAATIRAGAPPEKVDYHAPEHDELVVLLRGLHPNAVMDAERLMEHHDFSTYSTLLEVGGGSGGLAIAMAQAHPHLKATVVELPSVAPVTREFVEAANAPDRVEILAADAIRDTLPGSYDVVVARHVVQVLSSDECRALLRNLASVLEPGGVLHLVGWVLDDSRLSPPNLVGCNLVLLNAYQDGQAYTEGEHREWLVEAGFLDIERVVMTNGASIVTARQPL
jgi:SAM-dependent methyltransferase